MFSRHGVLLLLAALGVSIMGVALSGLLAQPGSRMLGTPGTDQFGTHWFYWWVHQILGEHGLGGLSQLDQSDMFFYPHGKDILRHSGSNIADALVASPFLQILGPVAGYNVFAVGCLIFNGWAFHRLAAHFTSDRLARGCGALCFALMPFALFELVEGRLTQAHLGLTALYLLMLWRSGTERGIRAPLLAGVLLALTGYQYWYYAFFAGLAATAHGLVRAARPPAGAGRAGQILGRHALIAGAALALCMPVILPLLGALDEGSIPGLLNVAEWTGQSIDVETTSGYQVVLAIWQPLGGGSGFVDPMGSTAMVSGRQPPWPLIALPCILLYLWRPGRLDRVPLLAMGFITGLIAMGPLVILGDHWLPNWPYILLVDQLSFLQRLWWPGRALGVTCICIALAVTLAISALAGQSLPRRIAAALVVLSLWIAELLWCGLLPFPSWDATVPPVYRCLAEAEEGAVIELPHIVHDSLRVYRQTSHGQRILGGPLESNPAKVPAEIRLLWAENTWLRALDELVRRVQAPESWSDADEQTIQALGYRYVIIHENQLLETWGPDSSERRVRTRVRNLTKYLEQMLGSPAFDDSRAQLYLPWGGPPPCQAEVLAQEPAPESWTTPAHRSRQEGRLVVRWGDEPVDLPAQPSRVLRPPEAAPAVDQP